MLGIDLEKEKVRTISDALYDIIEEIRHDGGNLKIRARPVPTPEPPAGFSPPPAPPKNTGKGGVAFKPSQ